MRGQILHFLYGLKEAYGAREPPFFHLVSTAANGLFGVAGSFPHMLLAALTAAHGLASYYKGHRDVQMVQEIIDAVKKGESVNEDSLQRLLDKLSYRDGEPYLGNLQGMYEKLATGVHRLPLLTLGLGAVYAALLFSSYSPLLSVAYGALGLCSLAGLMHMRPPDMAAVHKNLARYAGFGSVEEACEALKSLGNRPKSQETAALPQQT